jgi:LysM repeat protein
MSILQTIVAAALVTVVLSERRPVDAQSLRGSHASVRLMYSRALETNLLFAATPQSIYDAVRQHRFAMLSVTRDVELRQVAYPFVLPRTLAFVNIFAPAYHAACGQRLIVTSGARPMNEQPRNASPESVHPTGMAVDFRKPAGACRAWFRNALLQLEAAHLIEATEEMHPPHFHVAVLVPIPLQYAAALRATASRVEGAAGTLAPSFGRLVTYRVQRGETLEGIAARYGTTADRIRELNRLRSPRVRPGQVLQIP